MRTEPKKSTAAAPGTKGAAKGKSKRADGKASRDGDSSSSPVRASPERKAGREAQPQDAEAPSPKPGKKSNSSVTEGGRNEDPGDGGDDSRAEKRRGGGGGADRGGRKGFGNAGGNGDGGDDDSSSNEEVSDNENDTEPEEEQQDEDEDENDDEDDIEVGTGEEAAGVEAEKGLVDGAATQPAASGAGAMAFTDVQVGSGSLGEDGENQSQEVETEPQEVETEPQPMEIDGDGATAGTVVATGEVDDAQTSNGDGDSTVDLGGAVPQFTDQTAVDTMEGDAGDGAEQGAVVAAEQDGQDDETIEEPLEEVVEEGDTEEEARGDQQEEDADADMEEPPAGGQPGFVSSAEGPAAQSAGSGSGGDDRLDKDKKMGGMEGEDGGEKNFSWDDEHEVRATNVFA